jgi:YHS domain-containing protein
MNCNVKCFSAVLLAASVLTAISGYAAEEVKPKPYPLKVCLVTGNALGSMGEPQSLVYKGQEFKFCCAGCPPVFNKDPDKYVKMLAEKVKEQQDKEKKEKEEKEKAEKEKPIPYPLKVCLVTGDELGSMGAPPSLVYKGQEFKFCCDGCPKDFNKDPEKYVKMLAEKVKEQTEKPEKK